MEKVAAFYEDYLMLAKQFINNHNKALFRCL